MATRKEARKKSLLQMLALVVVAAVVIAVVVLAQSWLRNKPDPEPQDTTLTAEVGDREYEIHPYLVAQPGAEPAESDVQNVEVGEDESLTITVPDHVFDHDWSAVLIYDDVAANDEVLHGPSESHTVEIPGSVDPVEDGAARPKLVVVEIQSVLIGHDDAGEETPFTTVWSVATQNAEGGDES